MRTGLRLDRLGNRLAASTDCGRSLWKSRDLRDFFGLNVAEIEHHFEGLLGFGSALGERGMLWV